MFRSLIRRFKERGGRDWQVLLLSLLLAFTVWFIYNLTAEYSAFIQYEIVARSSIEGHKNVSRGSSKLIVRGKATGFYILKTRMSSSVPTVVDVPPALLSADPRDDEKFVLNEDGLREILPLVAADRVQLEYLVTGTLSFTFPVEACKKVPVVPNVYVSCPPQYMQTGDILVEPDSVLIYGPENALRRMNSVQTESVHFRNVSSGKEGVIAIKHPEGIRLSDDMARFSVTVTRYVEMSATVSISVKNVPQGHNMILLPSRAEVVYRVPFPNGDTGEGFEIGVDYQDFIRYESSVSVPLKVFSMPEDVISYRIFPATVDVIIKE